MQTPRPATDVNGNVREWTPAEHYAMYFRGFRDGAAISAMKHSGFEAYERGYKDGQQALRAACDAFGKEVGHTPSILRTQDEEPAKTPPPVTPRAGQVWQKLNTGTKTASKAPRFRVTEVRGKTAWGTDSCGHLDHMRITILQRDWHCLNPEI